MKQEVNLPESTDDAKTLLAAERTMLAHERTLLAWTRTATALISFGFGIQQTIRALRGPGYEQAGWIGPREYGFSMILSGLIALLLAVLQNRRDMRILRARHPGLPNSSARHLAALIAISGLVAFLVMLSRS